MREIKSAIRKLQNNKANGSDLICSEILKLGITYLTPLIQKLFNEILNTAQFPIGWMDGWMNGVLGHFYALSRLNWAEDNLG